MKKKVLIENLSITEKEAIYGGFSDCISMDEDTFGFSTNPTYHDRICHNINCTKTCEAKESSKKDTLTKLSKREKGKKIKYQKHKTNETACITNSWVCVER
ncbi:hypothetical protein [Raineya orbicola]|jgi:hypothetical protein|uniref:Uncharacterized protein n=1 Tax=Raineya orbicola TaxID=2016530 RepID=A0A2N3I7N8_9BACT|nr:hypothetical protein [Raineya orbicola]PKQ66309.1 hypothetical protein Rain11_2429 [Raineya orbicola]